MLGKDKIISSCWALKDEGDVDAIFMVIFEPSTAKFLLINDFTGVVIFSGTYEEITTKLLAEYEVY